MSKQRILVITGLMSGSGTGIQETYNATRSNYQWSFSLTNTTGGIYNESSKLIDKQFSTKN